MKKIMFNDAYGLTQATIEGRKTMTRRLISPKLGTPVEDDNFDEAAFKALCCEFAQYKVGEVVAVAQSYERIHDEICKTSRYDGLYGVLINTAGWRNKMFVKAELMPHRIRITGIHVERLQDISNVDCIREGISYEPNSAFTEYVVQCDTGMICLGKLPRIAFAALIDKVSGRGTWASNPWVVAYEYELVK